MGTVPNPAPNDPNESASGPGGPLPESVQRHREQQAAQDRQWREQGQQETGGSPEGWGLHDRPAWAVTELSDAVTWRGRAVEIRSLEGFATIRAQLSQGISRAAVPTVAISDGAVRLGMTTQQARALAHILTGFARMAGAL